MDRPLVNQLVCLSVAWLFGRHFFSLLLRVGDGCPRVEAHFESFIACLSVWLFICPPMADKFGELNDGLRKFILEGG